MSVPSCMSLQEWFDYVPHRRGGGHIVFGADSVGVGVSVSVGVSVNVSVTLSCFCTISHESVGEF